MVLPLKLIQRTFTDFILHIHIEYVYFYVLQEDFMKRFGYIDSGPNTADALYTEDGFKKAVQEMQRFGGLPETGELDEATLNLTRAPRCGVPDVLKNQKQRQRRYIIGSNAWRKRGLTYL